MWLSDRVKLKGTVKAVCLECFPTTGQTLGALKKHDFVFFRIRSAAAGTKVSLGRILKSRVDFRAPTSRDPNLWLLLHQIFEICWDFLQGARISLFHVY